MVDAKARTIQIVLIPADNSLEIQQIPLNQPADDAIGCMLKFAQKHFSGTKVTGKGVDVLRQQMQQQMQEQAAKAGGSVGSASAIDESVFERLKDMTTCDVTPLVPNTKAHDFVAVNLITDDKGVAKDLPINVRAGSIARSCGLALEVRGDAFIARQFDDEDGFRRLDFTLDELSADAPWVRQAKAWHSRTKDVEQTHAVFTAAMGRSEAKAAKDRGNALVTKKEFAKASAEYEAGLSKLNPSDTTPERADLELALRSNLSFCRLKVGDPNGALIHAQVCTAMKPGWAKAWFRRAEAYAALGRKDEALSSAQEAARLAPDSLEIQAKLEELSRSS